VTVHRPVVAAVPVAQRQPRRDDATTARGGEGAVRGGQGVAPKGDSTGRCGRALGPAPPRLAVPARPGVRLTGPCHTRLGPFAPTETGRGCGSSEGTVRPRTP